MKTKEATVTSDDTALAEGKGKGKRSLAKKGMLAAAVIGAVAVLRKVRKGGSH